MTKSKAISRYSEYNEVIQEYMTYVIKNILETYGEVPDQFIMSLDMLADTYKIMQDAKKAIEDLGITTTDKYRGEKGNYATNVYFQSMSHIKDIIKSFALTPMSRSRLKKTNDVNIQEMLDQLTA